MSRKKPARPAHAPKQPAASKRAGQFSASAQKTAVPLARPHGKTAEACALAPADRRTAGAFLHKKGVQDKPARPKPLLDEAEAALPMRRDWDILIVGGGAAGMAAALAAAQVQNGLHILIAERQPRVGRKLLATGNGRCNLSNTDIAPAHYFSAEKAALETMLAAHETGEVPLFFRRLGLFCGAPEDGRLYPYCNQAAAVLDVLRTALDRAGIETVCDAEVQRLLPVEGGFDAQFAGGTLRARRVILAAGGLAAPQLGGQASGYRLAQSLGHRVTALSPALTPLICESEVLGGLRGVRAHGRITLLCGGAPAASEEGEIQFTENGLSGIPVFQLTAAGAGQGPETAIKLDLLPAFSERELSAELRARRAASGPGETLEIFLQGLLQKKLACAILKTAGLAPLSRPAATLSDRELSAAAGLLKGWVLPVTGTAGWTTAQVTAGGVPLSEICPDGASRLCPGLYLAGELLDAVGECGGFNLDWAFSTGLSAGAAAAR